MADPDVTYETLNEEDLAGLRRNHASNLRDALRQAETNHYQFILQQSNPGIDGLPDTLDSQIREAADRIKRLQDEIATLDPPKKEG